MSQTTPSLVADALPSRAAAIGVAIPVLLFTALPVLAGVDGGTNDITLNTARIARTLGLQLTLSATIGVWLWRQGWRPHRTAMRPFAWADLLRGLGLWIAFIVAAVCWMFLCRAILPEVFAVAWQTQLAGRPALWISVPFVLFNAVFEELIWLSLGITAFRRFGIGAASVLSVGLRLVVHAYQGPLALMSIIPLGTVFTLYYLRTRRLWPVIVAHAFQDLLALGALAMGVSGRGAA